MIMPKWEIHRKWARILGISDRVSKEVDELIDFPERCSKGIIAKNILVKKQEITCLIFLWVSCGCFW